MAFCRRTGVLVAMAQIQSAIFARYVDTHTAQAEELLDCYTGVLCARARGEIQYCLQCVAKDSAFHGGSNLQARHIISTRILGRRMAPCSPFLISNRAPHGVTPRS